MSSGFRSTLRKLILCKAETVTQVKQLASTEALLSNVSTQQARQLSSKASFCVRRNSLPSLSTTSAHQVLVRQKTSKTNLSYNHDDDDKAPRRTDKGLRKVGVLGVPTSLGQPRAGTELGPQYLRSLLKPKLEEMSVDVKEYGDVRMETIANDNQVFNLKWPKSHAHNAKKISSAVAQVVRDDRLCITLGGDHSLGLGSVHGHASVHPDVAVVWVDAHADLNTPLSSPSMNFHGMPASFFIRETQEYVPHLPEFDDIQPCINAKDIVYVGLRQMDPGEKVLMAKFGIKHYSMHDVDNLGIARITEEILDYLKLNNQRPVHMSVDIDSLDPMFAMSTGTPVLGGLKLREVLYLTEEIRNASKLSVIDMVEVNPKLETWHLKQTLEAATNILSTAIGGGRAGFIPDGYVLKKPERTRLKPLEDNLPVPYDEEG